MKKKKGKIKEKVHILYLKFAEVKNKKLNDP